MKHKTCNLLADHIIQRAQYHQQVARTYAELYACNDNKEDQQTFRKACEIEKELRELHSTVCLYLHKIEEELNVK
jgi:hemerythrin superfamily protein